VIIGMIGGMTHVGKKFLYPMLAAAAGVVVLLAGCGLLRKPPPKANEGLVDVLAGRRELGEIIFVNKGGGFVVVRTSLASVVKDEVVLVAKSGGTRTATLAVSPEKKKSYLTADIRDGDPRVGEKVFFPSRENLTRSGKLGDPPPPDAAVPLPDTASELPRAESSR
jgi:hypothetical protein